MVPQRVLCTASELAWRWGLGCYQQPKWETERAELECFLHLLPVCQEKGNPKVRPGKQTRSGCLQDHRLVGGLNKECLWGHTHTEKAENSSATALELSPAHKRCSQGAEQLDAQIWVFKSASPTAEARSGCTAQAATPKFSAGQVRA